MIELQSNFTTTEQSKRLLAMGVPAESADCYYSGTIKHIVVIDAEIDKKEFFRGDIVPCWSVGRLIEIGNICSIPKIKEAGFHLLAQDFDDLIETMIISIKMKVEHGWIDFSKLE